MNNTFDFKDKSINLDADDIQIVLELEDYEKRFIEMANEIKKIQTKMKELQGEIETRREILARRIKFKIEALRGKEIIK